MTTLIDRLDLEQGTHVPVVQPTLDMPQEI